MGNVYIGPGVKIFGLITIGNNMVIGANVVANKSFPVDVVLTGISVRIIRGKERF